MVKPLSEYHKKKSQVGGHRSQCKECRAIERRKYYLSNKSVMNSYTAEYIKTDAGKRAKSKAQKRYADANKDSLREKRKQFKATFPERSLLNSARSRAKRNGIPFNLTEEDVRIPEYCPALGIRLEVGEGKMHQGSPSLDRIIPEKGYTKGNVIVVSLKANAMKSNATIDEIRKLLEFYEKVIK